MVELFFLSKNSRLGQRKLFFSNYNQKMQWNCSCNSNTKILFHDLHVWLQLLTDILNGLAYSF